MPKTKGAGLATQKWAKNAGQATDSYAAGVQNPKTEWKQAALAGAENYKKGVTAAANQNRFNRGVQNTPDGKQQMNALQKGTQRFAPGVQMAQGDYNAAMEPVIRTIEAVTLPARGPKGDPNNLNRVAPVANALHALKTGTGK